MSDWLNESILLDEPAARPAEVPAWLAESIVLEPAPPAPKPAAKPGVAEDVAKAIPAGLVRGTAGLSDAPSTIGKAIATAAADWISPRLGKVLPALAPDPGKRAEAEAIRNLPMITPLGSGRALESIEALFGPLYKPQTTPGKYVGAVAEAVPGTVIPGGTLATRAAMGVTGALAGEAAGQATEGTALEPWARVGAGITGAGAVGLLAAPRGARSILQEATRGASADELASARTLVDEAARQPGGGVRLTLPEAMNQVTEGRFPRLSQVERVVANSGGEGARRYADLYAARPGAVRATGAASIDGLAPNAYPPEAAALRGQTAGARALDAVREARTADVDVAIPYALASRDSVPPDRMRIVAAVLDRIIAEEAATPEIAAGARELRNRIVQSPGRPGQPARWEELAPPPGRERPIRRMTPAAPAIPEVLRTNVGELDDVVKFIRDNYGARPTPFSGLPERNLSRVTNTALSPLNEALETSSPALRRGRERYGLLSREMVEPVENGPVGRIAGTDPGQAGASVTMGRFLAGADDAANSAPQVADSVRRLATADPRAAETLARDYIAKTFDDAVRDLKSGPDQYGGAGFRAALAGSPGAMAKLEALVTNLPNGAERWAGFRRLLDVFEATGYRPAKGSDTAFNEAIKTALAQSRGVGGAIAEEASKGGLGLKQTISDRWLRFRMGRNTEEAARILTDPAAMPLLAELARLPVGSERATVIATQLLLTSRPGAERAAGGR